MDRHEAVVEAARADLRDHMRDFMRYGPAYLDEYIGALESDANSTWKAERSNRLHPQLSKFLREIALDAATTERRETCGAAAPSSNGAVDSAQPSRRKAAA